VKNPAEDEWVLDPVVIADMYEQEVCFLSVLVMAFTYLSLITSRNHNAAMETTKNNRKMNHWCWFQADRYILVPGLVCESSLYLLSMIENDSYAGHIYNFNFLIF
jgi:hypothetical protein